MSPSKQKNVKPALAFGSPVSLTSIFSQHLANVLGLEHKLPKMFLELKAMKFSCVCIGTDNDPNWLFLEHCTERSKGWFPTMVVKEH